MSDESQASQQEEMLKQTEIRNAVQKIIHVTDCNLSHQTKSFTSNKKILLYPSWPKVYSYKTPVSSLVLLWYSTEQRPQD